MMMNYTCSTCLYQFFQLRNTADCKREMRQLVEKAGHRSYRAMNWTERTPHPPSSSQKGQRVVRLVCRLLLAGLIIA